PGSPDAIDQLRSAATGNASATATLRATPAPLLVTVTVYPTGSPADTDDASAVFVIATLPQLIVIGIGPAAPLPSFVVVKLAVLSIVEQSALVVAEVTCTLTLAAGARSAGP